MKRLIFVVCALLLLTLCACGKPQKYSAESYDAFDTVISVTAYCRSSAEFDKLSGQAFARFAELSRKLDIYYEYSGMNNLRTLNLAAGREPVELDGETLALLRFCREVYDITGGKVNVAMGSVLRLWHDARENGVLPEEDALRQAAEHCDINALVIDEAAGTAYLTDGEMSLDVGAVAKGWAAQRVADELKAGGFGDFVISAGGNVITAGSAEGGRAWRVGVQSSEENGGIIASLDSRDEAVVTSSGSQRYVEIDGVRYHHIIDPQTLAPAKYLRSMTVVHPDSGMADALSTALFLMEPAEALAAAEAGGYRIIMLTNDGELTDSADR